MNKRLLTQILIPYLFLLAVLAAYADSPMTASVEHPVAIIENNEERFDLNPYLEILEDTAHAYTLENIQAGKYEQLWQRNLQNKSRYNPQHHFIGRNAKSKYWFRITLEWHGAANSPSILYFDHLPASFAHVGIVLPDPQRGQRIFDTGHHQPYNSRDIKKPLFAFHLSLTDKRQTIFGWIDNSATSVPPTLPLYLVSTTGFDPIEDQFGYILVGFYAIIAAMLLYNVCLFVTLRESVYGWYIAFLAGATLLCSALDGVGHQWLWSETPVMNMRVSNNTGVISVIIYMVFVVRALNNAEFWPEFKKVFNTLLLIGCLAQIYVLFSTDLGNTSLVAQIYPALVIPNMIVFIIVAIRKRQPTAGYLLIAEITTVSGAICFMLMMNGVIAVSPISSWGLHWGFVGEALLFSLALAARTRLARDGKALAEAKNQAKSQFFASMSHEFRTPLAAILGYANLIKDSSISYQDRFDHIETIEISAQHLLQLINDILDISKIEAQKLHVEKIVIDLTQLLGEVQRFIAILASAKHISFELTYQFPLPKTIISDPTRLKQTLINLCANAVKFTHKGGVKLHVLCDATQQSASQTAGHSTPQTIPQTIQFAIQDTGIGLKPEQIKNLFSAFTQADDSISRQFGGTGLGLYLSKQFAEKLGGDIRVESEFGVGSTFTLQIATGPLDQVAWLDALPKRLYPNGQPPNSQRSNNQQFNDLNEDRMPLIIAKRTLRILLAEDNPVNQKLISFHLRQAGVEVVIANDGVEAVQAIGREEFDLVLIDMEMPHCSGMAAVRMLRSKGFSKPMYALTANESAAAIQECKDAGCNGHLSKPLDIEKLKAVLI